MTRNPGEITLLVFQRRGESRSNFTELSKDSISGKRTRGQGQAVRKTNDKATHIQKHEAISVVLLYRRPVYTQNSAKPTQGVWGRAPSIGRGYALNVLCIAADLVVRPKYFCILFHLPQSRRNRVRFYG
jgi:hypothetical protein